MPFSCLFQLNNGAIATSDIVIFQKYILSSFDHYHENSVKIAEAIFNGSSAFIYTNCPCYVSSIGALKQGDKITELTIIGYFSADGESIPYDKPYAIIKTVD